MSKIKVICKILQVWRANKCDDTNIRTEDQKHFCEPSPRDGWATLENSDSKRL